VVKVQKTRVIFHTPCIFNGILLPQNGGSSDENQTLAESRLAELEKMKSQHQEALKELEKLKIDVGFCEKRR